MHLLDLKRIEDLPGQLEVTSPRFVGLVVWDSAEDSVPALERAVDLLLNSGAVYVCTFGSGCERLHDVVDETLAIRSLKQPEFDQIDVSTTWHTGESLDDTLWYWVNTTTPFENARAACESSLAIVIGGDAPTRERVRFACTAPRAFSSQVHS